jgi:hypothetical protein
MGSTVGLEAVEKRKSPLHPCLELKPDFLLIQPKAWHYSNSAILTPRHQRPISIPNALIQNVLLK